MRIGLIAEFNPLHTGHKYLISEAKKIIAENGVGELVCVMSEFFTQRGEVAIIDGYSRAREAIYSGCDLVIALPYRVSVAFSDDFAHKSIEILVNCKITHLIFGTEEDIEKFEYMYNLENSSETTIKIKEYLKLGYSYPKIMSKIFEINSVNSNFILAYSYYKAIKKLAPNIKLIPVKRRGQNLNQTNLDDSEFLSATSIRKNYANELIKNYISENMYNNIFNKANMNEEKFYNLLKYKILSLGKENLKNIYDVTEGLENRIYQAALISNNYDELVALISTKRYTNKRIKRILSYVLTNSSRNEMLEDIKDLRILAVNKNKTYLIKEINKLEKVKLHQKLNKNNEKYFKHDIRVARIYNIFYNENDIFKYNIEIVE
ncbi:tRNA(Met) cytidine acetate ligase [Gemelliphila palaticanis]|uniref:tRNA(Met) cytidine acetate ligase n=1 Tax=Gemelliphila palaticanis TaxID=81950 RepID=A0ABX2T0Q1_9BACL|nr:nucleotidyltransferase family protein [Gemella palaticanis]MBF0714835.1 nucleotidyltransferase family protein [Gemella palaticanis]NYS46765.1 nucleotidyltransferase family protein [Gemella palaticanis]